MPEKNPIIRVAHRPFVAVAGSLPAINEALTLDVEQYRHIDPATLPSGVSVTVTDGTWQPITLTRHDGLLRAQVRLDLSRETPGQRRELFFQALTDAADSLAYKGEVTEPTVVATDKGRHVIIGWTVPFDPGVALGDGFSVIRFRWDVLYSRAEKMLGR